MFTVYKQTLKGSWVFAGKYDYEYQAITMVEEFTSVGIKSEYVNQKSVIREE